MVGITGLIGSGKSRVSRFLADRLNSRLIDADGVAARLMAPGQPGWRAIKGLNSRYIMADGRLDRARLRQDIFSDPAIRETIDALIHPLIKKEVERSIAASAGMVLVEAPLLFEAGWQELFDVLVLVYADQEVCERRVMHRDGVDRRQAQQAFACQMPAALKIERAHHVIDNSNTWWETQLQLLHLATLLAGNSRKGEEMPAAGQK